MKNLMIITITLLCLFACNKEAKTDLEICGVDKPIEDIPWLAEIVAKAKTDKTGNYWGTIWIGKYSNQDIFIVDMSLGSGGVAYYFFDCKGNYVTNVNINNVKFIKIIYSNITKN